jgi:hypothetical protein
VMRYHDIHRVIADGTAARVLPGWARRVLEDIASGRSTITAVRHPLGFLCLPVERAGDLGVCLHLWSPQVRPAETTTSTVHCHSWELVSFVLYGAVRNARGGVLPPGDGPTHRMFEVVSGGGVDELRATGQTVRYGPVEARTHRAGEVYTLPAGVFHSTTVEGPDAATVALGRQVSDQVDLSLGPLDLRSHRIRRERCGAAETAGAAARSARRITTPRSLEAR